MYSIFSNVIRQRIKSTICNKIYVNKRKKCIHRFLNQIASSRLTLPRGLFKSYLAFSQRKRIVQTCFTSTIDKCLAHFSSQRVNVCQNVCQVFHISDLFLAFLQVSKTNKSPVNSTFTRLSNQIASPRFMPPVGVEPTLP